MEKINFQDFQKETKGQEGIVLLGCGGELSEWTDGVTKLLLGEEIITTNGFSKIFVLETTGGRTDIAMVLNPLSKVNIGKMAIWRLQFGDCSWISDYVDNYANQHGFSSSRDDILENDTSDEMESEEYDD